MFNFFKKKNKNIETKNVNNLKDAIKVINNFVLFEDYDKALLGIKEIEQKESEAFNNYISTIENEKEKIKKIEIFKKSMQEITNLKVNIINKKKKYKEKKEKIKKEQNIKNITKEIDNLLKEKEFFRAANLLNDFLDENKDDFKIVKFINKQKKLVNSKIEKSKKEKEKDIKTSTIEQAKELIGEINEEQISVLNKDEKKQGFIKKIINSYFNIRKKLQEKKLYDEFSHLIEDKFDESNLMLKNKLLALHSGSIKEISNEKINGFEIYGKIMSADKISGDSIGFKKTKDGNKFYIGDATGHGMKAGFTITKLSTKFLQLDVKYTLEEIVFEINNFLKESLNSGNFITSIFFNIREEDKNTIEYVGLGHEPMFIFRKKTKTVEKIIPGGLAAGIRIIKDKSTIKKKFIKMDDGDVLFTYSDGIVEERGIEKNDFYGFDRLGKKIQEIMSNPKISLEDAYKKILDDLVFFTGGKKNFNDDITLFFVKRDKNKEILNDKEDLQKLGDPNITKNLKKFKGKTFEEIKQEVEKKQKETALLNIINILDGLYKTGEILKLKQECIRAIKDGFIHKKINFYLKNAIENETKYKLEIKNKKMTEKYNLLQELYKKGEYEAVINEVSTIIGKDGNI